MPLLAIVALLHTAPAEPPRGVVPELGAAVSYGLRLSDDGRAHGAAAHVWGAVPLFSGFGARVGAFGAGWLPSDATRRPLRLVAGELELVYALDSISERLLLTAGLFGGAALDGELTTLPHAGVSLGAGVRLPLAEHLGLSIDARLPYHLLSPEGLTLPGAFGGGPPAPLFPFEVHLAAGLVVF